jgi:hypothetical protein
MENNAVQEKPVPEKSEKEESLEKIVSLSDNISASYKSIKIVGFINVVAAFGYAMAVMLGLYSPFVFPALMTVLIGNHVYIFLTRKKDTQLEEMSKTHESKFGVVTLSD